MTKSPGVIASGVVSIIGSVLFLLIAAVMVFVVPPPVANAPDFRAVSLVSAAMLAALSALGIATGVGLLRLRPWARISILVFAGIMSGVSLMTGLMMAFIPLPSAPNVDASFMNAMRPVLVGLYVVPFLTGVWWLIQFNTQRTKAAFASNALDDQNAGRPIGISILGWWFLVSGVFCVIPAGLRMPAFVGGIIWTGWSATAIYVAFGAIWCYLGAGLLRLEPRARVGTIVGLVLATANGLVMFFVPSARDRMVEYQKLVSFGAAAQPMPDMNAMYTWIGVMSSVLTAGLIFYLVGRRSAFHGPSTPSV
jgi:hypothetical protein